MGILCVTITDRPSRFLLVLVWLLDLAACSMPTPTYAEARVQEMTGYLDAQDALIYELSALRKGETLYVYAEGTSGNRDPSAGV